MERRVERRDGGAGCCGGGGGRGVEGVVALGVETFSFGGMDGIGAGVGEVLFAGGGFEEEAKVEEVGLGESMFGGLLPDGLILEGSRMGELEFGGSAFGGPV